MIFEDVKECKSGNLVFSRIFIKYRYDDNTVDKLSIKTPEYYSFGISECLNEKDKTIVDNYQMSLVMLDSTKPTEDQLKTLEMIDKITNKIKSHLKLDSTKSQLKNYEMDALVDLMKMYWLKKDNGKVVAGASPVLYPKLLKKFEKTRVSGMKPEIMTGFYDTSNAQIEASTLVGKRFQAIGELVVDHVYIGSKPSIQLKLNDVIVVKQFSKERRLFYESTTPKSTADNVSEYDGDVDDYMRTYDTASAPAQNNSMRRKLF